MILPIIIVLTFKTLSGRSFHVSTTLLKSLKRPWFCTWCDILKRCSDFISTSPFIILKTSFRSPALSRLISKGYISLLLQTNHVWFVSYRLYTSLVSCSPLDLLDDIDVIYLIGAPCQLNTLFARIIRYEDGCMPNCTGCGSFLCRCVWRFS